jgi:hypothetical protein
MATAVAVSKVGAPHHGDDGPGARRRWWMSKVVAVVEHPSNPRRTHERGRATARWWDAGAAAVRCRDGGLVTCSYASGGRAARVVATHEWMHGKTLPASSLVDSFHVKNEGKRAVILRLVGCQRAQNFGPGEIGPGKTPGSLRESGLPK